MLKAQKSFCRAKSAKPSSWIGAALVEKNGVFAWINIMSRSHNICDKPSVIVFFLESWGLESKQSTHNLIQFKVCFTISLRWQNPKETTGAILLPIIESWRLDRETLAKHGTFSFSRCQSSSINPLINPLCHPYVYLRLVVGESSEKDLVNLAGKSTPEVGEIHFTGG